MIMLICEIYIGKKGCIVDLQIEDGRKIMKCLFTNAKEVKLGNSFSNLIQDKN